MGLTSRLVYDPTDADSRAAGSSVGALLLAGSDATPIGHTAGALNVNITSGFIDVDDGLANTDISTESTLVGTTAVNTTAAILASRKYLGVCNNDNKTLYFGKTGVTTATGWPVYAGAAQIFRIGPAVTTQLIGGPGSNNQDIRVLQLS